MGKPAYSEARYADYVPVFPTQQRTAAQKAGISFEKAVIKKLTFLYGEVKPGPWLYYRTPKKAGVCQPDALVELPDNRLCVVEVKQSWMRPVRQKLLNFYGPIVELIHPDKKICYLQVYKNAKPSAHKKPVSIYELELLEPNKYKECQWLGL